MTMPDVSCRRWNMTWNPATGLIRRPRIALICSSRLPDLRGCSNWPSPDAPGLFSFGAQFDPALADSLHDGSPMVGVSGVGLTLRDAFQGCIGEGIEYLSQLQAGTDLLLKPGVDDWAGKLGPKALELVAAVSERCMQPERVLSWCRATRLTDGGEVWLPADICLRRPPAQRDFAPPFPLSIGSAAGSVTGCRSTARPAGIDRARCGQPVVAGRSTGPIDSAAA